MPNKAGINSIGGSGFLSDVVVVGGDQLACNRLFADWWQSNLSDSANEVTACLKQSKRWTGVTKIGGAFWSTSWDMTEPASESFTCEKYMSMSARIPLAASSYVLRG